MVIPIYYFDDDEPECDLCYGQGFILTCPDDLCQNPDEGCIHGDGEDPCPMGCGL